MNKFLSVVLSLSMICSISVVKFAAEPSVDYLEELSFTDDLADQESVSFLIENDELDDLYQAQEEIRDSVYNAAAECAAEAINEPDITSDDIQYLTEKFDLDLPFETAADIIDEGTIIAQRSNSGTVIDI